MQTWAKRGIQTALVTGGLLMLGTGIASADEQVNPDRPASPLDGKVSVPINVENNAIGTPGGQVDLPEVKTEINLDVSPVTDKLPAPVQDAAGQAAEQVNTAAEQAAPTSEATTPAPASNQVTGDVVAPVDVSGNALALGGDVAVDNESKQEAATEAPVRTDGSNTTLGGNAVDLDWAAPVAITGNAVSVLGDAESTNNSTQSAQAAGDIDTNGEGGLLAGNTVAGQLATPVQLTGNAIAGGGDAETNSTATSEANAGGSIVGSGEGGALSGTVGALPVAAPVELNGSALGVLGEAEAHSDSSANATAGGTKPGVNDVPSYIQTTGDDGLLAGTVAQAPLATPVVVAGTAAGVLGEGEATGSTSNDVLAGGFDSSSGVGGLGSGTIANAPVAVPVEAITHAVAVGGAAEALHDNEVSAVAGDGSFTNGNESALSGTSLATPIAGPADLLGNSVAVLGAADTTGAADREDGAGMNNEAEAIAGGYTGTIANDALGSGNAATVPVALPVEGFADSVGVLGTSDAAVTEHKVSEAGGDTSTVDDDAVLSANAVQVPVAGAAQLFGATVGGLAETNAFGDATNEISAGGNSAANGVGGTGSGNIVQAPASVPAQVFGIGASALSLTNAGAVNDTIMTSGGDAGTDGTEGNISGNVVSAPVGALAHVFGDQVSALGVGNATADNLSDVTTGGAVETAGDDGFVAGNAVTPQVLPAAQVFGDAVDVAGLSNAVATNDVVNTTGGDVTTSGEAGSLSGNILDVPAAAVVDVFGDAIAALGGDALGVGDNTAVNTVGGEAVSEGGFAGQLPVGVVGQIHQVPVSILAQALAASTNDSETSVGNSAPQLEMAFDRSELPVDALPALPAEQPVTLPAEAPQTLPAQDAVTLPAAGAPQTLPAQRPVTLPAHRPAERSALPASGPAMSQVGSGGLFDLQHRFAELQGKPFHIQ
ncbi:hypothetical protein EV191_1011348 [Tamaricihabitans halophyticus]|uniref:Small secreted domain DUF320 n=1 Tax=Tamaricihabitans halophyticus TaxID=1262583 RepID=A0A4R2R491_9PSEU|nr:hypothetical protein [Tamaricihabitans halophyticus]TCP57393.1 hypothetical protein EV191_1011348 [Tamaricihabitans halophyticus]